MADEQNDNKVRVDVEAEIPSWFRSAMSKWAPLIAAFTLGNVNGVGVLSTTPTEDDIRKIVREENTVLVQQYQDLHKNLSERTTDLEKRYVLYAKRMEVMEKKLATRNR